MSVSQASESVKELIRRELSRGGTPEQRIAQIAQIDTADIRPLIQEAVDSALAIYFMGEFWERKPVRHVAPGNFFIFRNYMYCMIGLDEKSKLPKKPAIVEFFVKNGDVVRCKMTGNEDAVEIRIPNRVKEVLDGRRQSTG